MLAIQTCQREAIKYMEKVNVILIKGGVPKVYVENGSSTCEIVNKEEVCVTFTGVSQTDKVLTMVCEMEKACSV